MATHSCILAWRIPWTEEPGRLQFIGPQRVGHDWSNLAQHSTDVPGTSHLHLPCFWCAKPKSKKSKSIIMYFNMHLTRLFWSTVLVHICCHVTCLGFTHNLDPILGPLALIISHYSSLRSSWQISTWFTPQSFIMIHYLEKGSCSQSTLPPSPSFVIWCIQGR